jgi:DNA-directed RNA polymerase subunit omega
MVFKEYLTNEFIAKKFNSQFDLVNFAVRLAEHKIKSGTHSEFSEELNPALEIIDELALIDPNDAIYADSSELKIHAKEEVEEEEDAEEKPKKKRKNQTVKK